MQKRGADVIRPLVSQSRTRYPSQRVTETHPVDENCPRAISPPMTWLFRRPLGVVAEWVTQAP
jgi:hypothetical protein